MSLKVHSLDSSPSKTLKGKFANLSIRHQICTLRGRIPNAAIHSKIFNLILKYTLNTKEALYLHSRLHSTKIGMASMLIALLKQIMLIPSRPTIYI